MIGQTLGRYHLEASLGRGGMAEVFRARDERLGRTVAVKVILPTFASEPHFAERFLREARLVASLEHPHILPVYDSGDENGVPFLVMPYLQGGTLVERMSAGALPPDTALRWIGELAEALDAAHARGVLHRDVKPANVLLGAGDRALLADFGIAKMAEAGTQLTATGVVIGTPTYMAPELAQGQPASPASDLYALGVLAYEMLTGAPPFSGESALSLLHQHVSTPPPLASARAPLPPALDAVFGRVLAKDPARRPASCREFAQELARGLEPVAALRPTAGTTIRTARTVHMPTPVPAASRASISRGGPGPVVWIVGAAVLLVAGFALWRSLATPPPPEMDKPAATAASSPSAPSEAIAPAPPSVASRTATAPAAPEPVPAASQASPTAAAAPPAAEETAASPSTMEPEPQAEIQPEAADRRPPAGQSGPAAADAERRVLQEVRRRGAESSPKEALRWFHDRLIADGVPSGRAALQTAFIGRRLWGAAVGIQVLQQACADGVGEACAELRKRPARRP